MKSKHLHRHDIELLALVATVVLAVGGYLLAGLGAGPQGGTGWRRIDTAAVRARIRTGELSDREARWYRAGGAARGRTRP